MEVIKGSTTFEMTGVLAYNYPGEPPHPAFFPLNICLQSKIFAVAGYYWCVRLYPTDFHGNIERFSLCLQLVSRGATVRASHELSVLDPSAVLPPTSLCAAPPRRFVSGHGHGDPFSNEGVELDTATLQVQCAGYVCAGRLLFQCTVTVFLPPEDPAGDRAAMMPGARVDVPPSDMLGRLGEALETGEGADVTFSVEGELFPAHKVVLAMRSPVFKAELFGEMRENANGAAQAIAIDDMRADTFRALLRYIYTDASPAAIMISNDNNNQDEGDDEDDSHEDTRIWELLMAADRYDVRRLKLICERILYKSLDVQNVADTLVLADQHHCDTLKDACIEFMTTSQRMAQVAETQGYRQLKSSHPYLLFEVLEKSSKFW